MGLATQLRLGLDAVELFQWVVRRDPYAWQSQLLESQATRILQNVHRQGGKSSATAALVLWTAAFDIPEATILCLSPTERQSGLMLSLVKKYLSKVPSAPKIVQENATRITLANGSQVWALPGGEGDSIRGFSGPDLIIVDEASRVEDELIGAVRPMLAAKPSGRMIMLSTPFGARGLFWKLWTQKEQPGEPGWERYTALAADCPSISKEFLDQERREMPPWLFRSEYECSFEAAGETALWSPAQIDRAFNCNIPAISIA